MPVPVGQGAHRGHLREHAQPVHEAAGGLEVLHVRPGRVPRAPEQNERGDREGPAEIAPRPVVDEEHGAGVPHLTHHRDQQRHVRARDMRRVHALDDVQAVRLGVLDAKRARGGGALICAHDSPSDNRTTGERPTNGVHPRDTAEAEASTTPGGSDARGPESFRGSN